MWAKTDLLTVFAVILAILGIGFSMAAINESYFVKPADSFLAAALIAFVVRALLIRWDRFAEQKFNVSKKAQEKQS